MLQIVKMYIIESFIKIILICSVYCFKRIDPILYTLKSYDSIDSNITNFDFFKNDTSKVNLEKSVISKTLNNVVNATVINEYYL